MNAPKLLHSFTNHENLQDFSRFLLTSMGPRSTLKMFQSGVGRVSVTSSSKRILGCLEIHNDPCVEAIVMSCKSFLERFGDHGLYLGYLTAQLTDILASYEPIVSSSLTSILTRIFQNSLAKNRVQIDFNELQPLLKIVKSQLYSKGGDTFDKYGCAPMLIVEGFLTSLDYKSGRMERLKVEVSCQGITNHRGEGPFQPVELVQGVLYRLPEKETDEKRLDFPRAEGKGHKILLLDLQLKVDLSDLHEFKGASEYSLKAEKQAALLEKLRLICRFCQRKQVQILANQRVIDEDAKALVRGFGILPLERLGRDTCSNLQLLAGSRPLQSFDVSDPSLSAALGTVESIDHIVRGDESYVHFKGSQASDGGIWTLYVKALNEDDEEEARLTFQKAIDVLYQILGDPAGLPGAGCFEAAVLKELTEWNTKTQQKIQSIHDVSPPTMGQIQEFLSRVANIFLKIIRQLHGIHNCGGLDTVENGSLAIDQEIGHLWVEKSGRAAQSCACGGREEEEKQEIFNLPLIGLEIVSDRIQLKSTKYRPQHLDCQSLDSFFVKSKMLEIAVETALSLSSIGMTIQM